MTATRSFHLGYSDATWGDMLDLEEVMSSIAAAGWEGVEIRSAAVDWLGTPRRLRGLIDQYGLTPVSMFGSLSLGSDASLVLERQRHRLEYAAEVGCSVYCVTGAQRALFRPASDDEFKQLAEMVEVLVDHATPLGLTIAYHRDGGYGHRSTIESEKDQDQLLRYAPRLRLSVDVAVTALKREDPV
ncbi:MAG: TIM barrel protein, partial [Dehalococcoidia bacterium]|nr:TIM barrel protein [Dehalococcoidia bacterium]